MHLTFENKQYLVQQLMKWEENRWIAAGINDAT